MADLSKFQINGVDYDLKDRTARQNSGSNGGNSVYYMDFAAEYPKPDSEISFSSVTTSLLSNNGAGIKAGDIIVASNGTICKVTSVSSIDVGYEPIGTINGVIADGGNDSGGYPDWSHLKWYVMGDSLTAQDNDFTPKRYYDFVREKTGIQTIVDGIGGTGYGAGTSNGQSFLDRVKNIPEDVDIVTIFGSGNDVLYNVDYNNPIFDTLAWFVMNRPKLRVIVVPPAPWMGYPKREDPWKAYCDRLQVCALACDFRYLADLWECPPFNPNFEGHMETFFTTDPTGIHPNEAGHEALATYFYNALAQELEFDAGSGINGSGGNVDQTFETVLALDEVRIGRYAKGVLESTYNRAICTRGYIKPFVVSATLTSADYQFAVAVYNNGAYVRTDGWLASGTVYTFDHDAYQYKMYIGRLDGEYVQDFDGCRQSVKLTISTADILKSYNALEIQSDTERRNTRNAVEYMMRRNYDISYANAPAPIGLTTYVGNNQIVHPKVLYFPNKFGGYMYWMAYTPYPFANEVYENPCVAYSNDGYNWVNVDGNPLDDPGGDGYNSDTHLVYVESTGTLELWYRYVSNYETTPVSEIIYRQTTNDGINWTEKEIVINNDSGDYVQYLSPAVIHDGGKYKVWAVNSTANTISYYDNGVPTPEETIALDDSMTVGKITQIGKVDETDTNYMHTEKIKLNATKSFRLTGVNLNGNTMHPALRYVTAYDADGNVLADYSLQSIAEVGGGLDRVITVDDSVDSVIISIYKAQNYTNKTITLPAVESDGELTKVRDITLNYQDGEKVYKPWHIDVIEDNGKTVLLVMCKCGTTWSLFLATSEDNETFTTPELVMVGNPYGWDTRLYRSCIVNVDGEYRIYYSAQDEIQKYGLGVSTSNTLSNFVGKW